MPRPAAAGLCWPDVQVEEIEKGIWMLKVGDFISESERWLHRPEVAVAIDEATEWAEHHGPRSSDLDGLEKRIKG